MQRGKSCSRDRSEMQAVASARRERASFPRGPSATVIGGRNSPKGERQDVAQATLAQGRAIVDRGRRARTWRAGCPEGVAVGRPSFGLPFLGRQEKVTRSRKRVKALWHRRAMTLAEQAGPGCSSRIRSVRKFPAGSRLMRFGLWPQHILRFRRRQVGIAVLSSSPALLPRAREGSKARKRLKVLWHRAARTHAEHAGC